MARKDVKYIEFDTPNAPKLMVDADASIEQIRDILKSGSFEEYMMGQGFAYKYGLQPVNTRLPENLDDNAFVSSAKSTIKNLQGIGTNLLAAIYDVFGNEEAQQNALKIYEQYKAMVPDNMTFIGRCGMYAYIDMHQAINSSLQTVGKFLEKNK